MKKIIFGLVLIILFATAIGIYFVLTNIDALVKDAIQTNGSAATQTSVRVDKVKIGLTDGTGTVSGLTIGNPSGFSEPYAFSLGEVHAEIDLQSLQDEPYIINEITVLAPQVFVEINEDKKTNLNVLKKNITASVPTTVGKKDHQEGKDIATDKVAATEPRLIIRRIIFTDGNIQARVAALNNKEYQLKLLNINMDNLGGSSGATSGELASEIINRLIDHASNEVKKNIIDAELNKIKAEARARIDAEKSQLKEKADSKLEAQKEKAKSRLKGLFGQ